MSSSQTNHSSAHTITPTVYLFFVDLAIVSRSISVGCKNARFWWNMDKGITGCDRVSGNMVTGDVLCVWTAVEGIKNFPLNLAWSLS